ncbi:chromosome transmission fidelity protein 8 homolog isoform X2 [Daphnia pulex]|uniref:chromosome transmission fidelity protein 8 homolog isoform X2 n=1 Tax=Daphnia pulex TaxID=6669 RepID=UPI001EDE676A|nr:chromosome transmission fidelity protein 8 homolog isoform X2 [Daphnia pulex]
MLLFVLICNLSFKNYNSRIITITYNYWLQYFYEGKCKSSSNQFQGDLETKSEEALGSKLIGDLHFNHEGHPIMIIGHHILHGKVQDLDKPLVVITKENDNVPDENNVTYGVTAVIKKKMIFKTRPKPIVGEMIKKL